jgi:hypothetical protein
MVDRIQDADRALMRGHEAAAFGCDRSGSSNKESAWVRYALYGLYLRDNSTARDYEVASGYRT